ncbi:hypothetical protein V8E53_013857 [Lactarius tabidus]
MLAIFVLSGPTGSTIASKTERLDCLTKQGQLGTVGSVKMCWPPLKIQTWELKKVRGELSGTCFEARRLQMQLNIAANTLEAMHKKDTSLCQEMYQLQQLCDEEDMERCCLQEELEGREKQQCALYACVQARLSQVLEEPGAFCQELKTTLQELDGARWELENVQWELKNAQGELVLKMHTPPPPALIDAGPPASGRMKSPEFGAGAGRGAPGGLKSARLGTAIARRGWDPTEPPSPTVLAEPRTSPSSGPDRTISLAGWKRGRRAGGQWWPSTTAPDVPRRGGVGRCRPTSHVEIWLKHGPTSQGGRLDRAISLSET